MNSEPNEPSFDDNAWDAAVALTETAHDLVVAGELERARALAVEAGLRLRSVVGLVHPDYAQALVVEGDALSALGRMGQADERFTQALVILEDFSGDDAVTVAPYRLALLARLGYMWSLNGHYAKAEAMLREALTVAAAVHGDGALELAEHYNTLGVCLRFAGRYAEAAGAYAHAGDIRDALGVTQPASHFHNLSGLASARDDFTAARRHAEAAIDARMDEAGEGFELGTDLCGLGDALVGLGERAEAEATYRRALALFAASPRADHPEVAVALHNLGDALSALGRVDEAEAAYRESIARKRVAFGEVHHEVAATLNNLAALLYDRGRHDEARRVAAEAVAIVTTTLDADHPVRSGVESLARSLR